MNTPYAALVDSSGGIFPLSNLPTGDTFNSIQSVSINSSAQSILVGHFGAAGVGGGGYEAFVSSSG
ncbi:MAG TPA: hypothetical protein DCE71_03160, partial [Parachlamydiales bacterium]|nr:hypothetical protein [Parachlamydiales bacterium]